MIDQPEQERWAPVKNYEGHYEVSTHGKVRSIARIVKRPVQGDCFKKAIDRKLHFTPKGYYRVQLVIGKPYNVMVHRLVAEAFIPNPLGKPVVNHKDGNKINNHVSNLEWVSVSENQIHAYDTGLRRSSVKYMIRCVQLGIVTAGTEKMVQALRDHGVTRASSSGVWGSIARGGRHLDLDFIGWPIGEPEPSL